MNIKSFVTSLVLFLILDSVWFALFMKKFAIRQIGNFMAVEDGSIKVNLTAAIITYLIMALATSMFLAPKLQTASLGQTVVYSFIFGLCLFGMFDLTNLALLKDYPLRFALIDMLWGAFAWTLVGLAHKSKFLA